MKIFVLVSRIPYPLEKGDKLRAYHQIRLLARHHEIFLCCLSDSSINHEAVEHLRSIVAHVQVIRLHRLLTAWRMIRALFSDRPFQLHYFFQSQASRKVRKAISDFQPDHIYCQLIRCSEYVKHLHTYQKTLDYMDALSAGLRRRIPYARWYQRPFIREESKRLVTYENLIFEYFDHHTIISEQDRQLIYHSHRKRIHVIPNGVDASFFTPAEEAVVHDIVFTGNMSYPPNVDCALRLAHSILPLIREVLPGTRLLIAGASPPSPIIAARGALTEVTGWIADIRPAYRSSRIFMAPMRTGSGTQNKLLEAMSHELPCITSPLAANALPDEVKDILVIAETDQELADAAVSLLKDAEKRKQLGQSGRECVKKLFDWEARVADLESIFTKAENLRL